MPGKENQHFFYNFETAPGKYRTMEIKLNTKRFYAREIIAALIMK
jgi:hypothetical protein